MEKNLKIIPSNLTETNHLSPTVNLVPSMIVEESMSVVDNEQSLVEKEKLPTVLSK
jgi:hypothetical protein